MKIAAGDLEGSTFFTNTWCLEDYEGYFIQF